MGARPRRLGPSYDEEQYWDEKFNQADESFEWLGSGSVLIDATREYCLSKKLDRPPRILHLGAGTSSLSIAIINELQQIYTSTCEDDILSSMLNVDFSQVALQQSRDQASQQGLGGMYYLKVDLRQWTDIASRHPLLSGELMDIILDKSTSDAIATNAEIILDEAKIASLCPLLQKSDIAAKLLDPLDLVATHLAAISKIGCIWAVLSYSSTRFDFFASASCISRRYWRIERKMPIELPRNLQDPHAPETHHYFYLLQRHAST